MKIHTKIRAACAGCGDRITFRDRPKVGQFVKCPYCSTDLEIINLDPLVLERSYFPEEDKDDYDYELQRGVKRYR